MQSIQIYRPLIAAGIVCAFTAAYSFSDELAHFMFSSGAPSARLAPAGSTSVAPIARRPVVRTESAAALEPPNATFDVARIDPAGVSVFAGQAPPNSNVTILADGQAVADAKADETGAWSAAVERRFAAGEREFRLSSQSADSKDVIAGQRVRMAVAATGGSASQPLARAAVRAAAPPGPITFVYNETTFTDEGRKAAALLAEYLISRRPEVASLSGHADERGSDRYNMDLSRQRLDVVAGYLRAHGFDGKLELIPKGEREPYRGADRPTLRKEDAFQFDRRVELHPSP